MQPRYSDYVSVSMSGNTIYTTVQVSGYTYVQIEQGCTLNGVTHQGKVYNTISTTGGWVYGPSVWPPNSINVTNNQTFTGIPGATYPFNWVAEVDCSMIGVFFHDSGTSQIPVVSTSISQRNTGTVSSDDAALSNYQTTEGTTNLGPIIGSGTSKGCFIGYETIGAITPSSYTGNVILHRTIASWVGYTNSTSTGGPPTGTDDTSVPALRDDDPQSGGSNGKVYDLDAPGAQPPNVDGKTYRIRANFYAYATLPDGTTISSQNYNFYVRLSCTKTATGYQFVNDVNGDNQIGTGTTKTTWNLQ